MDFENLLEECTYVGDNRYAFIFCGGSKAKNFHVLLMKKEGEEYVDGFEVTNPMNLFNAQAIMRFKESLQPKLDAFYKEKIK